MSNFNLKMSLWVVLLLLLTQNVFTQPSKGGTPPSITFQIQSNLPTLDYSPNINLKSLMLQDSINEKQGLPLRGGISVPVSNVGLNSGGTWTRLPDGRMMWQAKFYCANAQAIGVVFDEFYIPEQAELYLYDINKQMIIGAFTSENNHPSMQFSTHILPGTTIVVEYVEPFNPNINQSVKPPQPPQNNISFYTINNDPQNYVPKGSFKITELMYIYRDRIFSDTKDLGDAGTCQVNINCSPEGDGWQVQKRGVARILFKEGASWYYCSGTLINNTLNNGQPYFLTAFHCGATASAADKNVWQFYFNFERPGCPNTGTPPNNMITGCTMKAGGDIAGGSDMQLVLLNSNPPLSWNPYFNGWDRNTTITAGGVGIHHPSGDAKKISTYTVTPTSGTWSGGATNAHWLLSWATTTNGAGVTEGGSSGSPLFKGSNKYVVGTLTGGASQCGGPMGTDYYGKFSYHWESNGTTADKQLKPWLDPAGTNPTTCPGYDPNGNTNPPVANFTASATTVQAGTTVQFTDLSTNYPTEWEWTFPGGIPSSSTIRNPSVVYPTPGTYTVTLKATNQYGSNTKTVTNYITVTAYTPPSNPIIIGTGTTSGTVIPLGCTNTARWVVSASIYLASEIGGSCIINSVAWNVGTARTDNRNISIWIKYTDLSAFSTASNANDLIADATLVYQGTFTPTPTGWFIFNLQTPFNYTAGKNIMIIAKTNGTAANAASNCPYTASTNRHQQWTGTTDPSANNGTINSNRPNIRLGITAYTAPVANFAGLNPIMKEDFEGSTFPPTGWTALNVDGGGSQWASSTSYNHTTGGIKSAAHVYSAAGMQDGYLITSQITNLPANAFLTFWSYNEYPTYYGGTYQGKNSVLISTTNTNPSSFTEIWSPTSVSASWVQTTLNLSAYAGQNIYIAFRYQGNDAHSWFLDDVFVGTENYTQITTYEGEPVTIYDKSTNNPIWWEWTTPGGTPPTQLNQNAQLTYYVAGLYNVTLKAANPAGANTKTVNNFVNVLGRPPISNFVGVGNLKNIYLQPFIPRTGSVNFYDRSQRVPTSWSWTFQNGTPGTSTAQNPTNIVYNSAGKFDVTLYTANNHGNNTGIADDYVVVGGLDTCTNMIETDNLTVYGYTNGLIPGHAADASGKIWRYAEFFDNNYPGKLFGFGMYVYRALGTGKTIKVTVWNDNGGVPGTVLYTETRNITSFTQGQYNIITFTTPVNITGKFYVGYELNYDATHDYNTHQFCGVMTTFRTLDTASTGYFSYGSTTPGTWYSFLNGFGNAASLWIDAIFEYNDPGPTITATATPGCGTGSVTITSSVTANQTFVLTDNSGNTLQTWTGNANSYTFTGLANGVYRGKTINGGVESGLSNAVTLTNDPTSVGGTITGTNTQICQGSNTGVMTLSGHTGNVLKWQKRVNAGAWVDITNTNTTYSEVPSSAGTWDYRAEVKSGSCPSAFSSTYTIIVDPTSVGGTLTGPNTSICLGASTGTMTVSGYTGTIQKWQKRLNAGAWQDIANVTNTYSETPGTAGTWDYRVEVKSGSCAVAYSNNFTITVNPLPAASASSNSPVCAGATLNLTSSPSGMTYSWSGPGGWTATTQNPSRTNITTAQAGTYTVTVTNTTTGCSATASTSVVVNTPPTASANSNSPLCAGATLNLTSTPNGMTSYSWSGPGGWTATTQNPSRTNITTAQAGTYTVTVTDGNNCTATASTNVVVNAPPTASANSNSPLCAGATLNLTSSPSGMTSYSWSGPGGWTATTQNPSRTNITTAQAGTYTVTVTDANNCTATASTNVVVNAPPTASANSNSPLCAGATLNLTSSPSGMTSYSWSGPGGWTATTQNPSITNITTSQAGTYTVTVTDANSCTGTASINVVVNALPAASANSNSPLCAGATLNLTSSPSGMAYSWSGPGGWTATTQNPSRTNITTAQAGTYTVTVTNSTTGCSATASTSVVVNAPPTASANSNSPLCAGATLNLTSTPNGMSSYSWSGPGGWTATTQNPSITNITTAQAGTYTVTVTDANSCTGTASINVVVNALPTASANSNSPLCAGATLNLTSSPSGMTYSWSGPGGWTATTQNPSRTNITTAQAGTYTVTVTNNTTGCSATASTLVVVNTPPTASITTNSPLCAGATLNLTASPAGMANYQWAGPGTWSATGQTASRTNITPAQAGTYTLTVYDANNCTATASTNVVVNTPPTATASSNSPVCENGTINLTATPAGMSYNWSGPNSFTSTQQSPSISNASAANVGTYSVTVTDGNNCSSVATTNVALHPIITVNAGNDQTIPNGTSTTLSGSVSGGSGSFTYAWSPSALVANPNIISTNTVNLTSTTNFTLLVTDQVTGCQKSDDITVFVSGGPLTATASATPTTICSGSSSQLNVAASGGSGTYTYSWSSNPSGFTSTLQNPVVSPTVTTIYTVTVNDGFNTVTSSVTVTVNPIPAASANSNSPLCAGATLNLTSSPSGMTYSWSGPGGWTATTQNPSRTNITTAQAGTYTVTITNTTTGCSATASTTVVVNAPPTVSANSNSPLCAGATLNLTSTPNGMTSYNWSGPGGWTANTQNPSITNITTAQAGTYTVTVTNSSGCTGTASINVVVNANPVASAGSNSPLCEGATLNLTSLPNAMSSYNWSGPGGWTANTQNPSRANITTAQAGTYTVTVTNSSGCTGTASINVVVNANPVASVGSNSPLCEGATLNLTSQPNAMSSYNWSGPGGWTANTQNPSRTNITPAQAGTYTVTVTNSSGCTGTASINVVVNANPTASATSNSPLCEGSTLNLTSQPNAMSSYSWSGPGGWTANTQNPSRANITPAQAGTYTVTVTNSNGCTGTASINVVVNALPIADAGQDVAICEGSSTTLTASGGTSYEWNTGAFTQSINVSPTTTTTYTVIVYDASGCSASDAVTVTVNPLPTANAGTDQIICEGSSTTLTATGGVSYLWSTNENTASIQVSPTASTLYSVTVTDINGCSNTDAVFVSVNPSPVVSAGNDQEVCEDVEVVLNATGALTYVWDNGVTNNVGFYPPVGTNTYTVVGTDAHGCTASDQVVVTVHPKPIANAGNDVSVCLGSSVNLTATGGDNYMWSNGMNTATITVSPFATTTYYVTVSNSFGCAATDEVVVTVHDLPVVSAGNDVSICEGQTTTLTATGGISYEWGTGETTSSIVVSPSLTTLYYVTVTDANGCSDVANVTVIVNTLPTVQVVSTNAQCGMSNGSIEAIVSGGSGNYTYQWDANAGNQTTALVENLPAGIYSVTVDDGYCPVESSGEIIEDGAPVITIQATATEICEGESITLIASGADSYVWSPSTYLNTNIGNEVIATPLTSITYTVTGTSGNCSAEESISIIVNPLPQAYMAISNISGGEYEFTDMSLNATGWLWDFGDGNTDNNQNTSHTYTADGLYTVMLIASNNCGSDTATQTIQVIINQISVTSISSSLQAYPNPNNGLFNLTLESTYKGTVNIVIYNVEGKKVFSQDIDKQAVKQNIPMNMKSLAKGLYRIVVKEGTDLKYATIVIDKL